MTDALKNMTFKGTGNGDGKDNFIKFKADVPVKIRVYTTNPTIHINQYGKEQITFAVWNWDENRAMLLSKGASIAKGIANLHNDEDFGADITKLDIKILPTGEDLNREYSINVLPKAQTLSKEQEAELVELDGKLDTIIKNSIRADRYNEGAKPPSAAEDIKIEDDPLSMEYLNDVFPE